ncbi:nuclear transport factor 2 family protein, partial [Mycolicibacterium pulveris]
MSQWSREEIEDAFHRYEQAVVEIGDTWNWSAYADQFTEDATYVEHAMGNMTGREPIREWIVSTMNTFPGSEMPHYPVEWYSIDTDKGW